MNAVKQVQEIVKNNFQGDLHHGWPHLNRVRKYAVYIAKKEGANVEVVEIAALLHDIAKIQAGYPLTDHAAKSAQMAQKILEEIGVDKNKITLICNCIRTHSRKEQPKPSTIDEKCLYDADGLELVGAVGILRSALYAAYYHQNWKSMARKVKTRIDANNTFLTKTGKTLGNKRIELITNFYKELEKELNWNE